MSNRTIIVINHDEIETINVKRFEFMQALIGTLRGHKECAADLEKLGAKVVEAGDETGGNPNKL